jgi:HEAT repeat protein
MRSLLPTLVFLAGLLVVCWMPARADELTQADEQTLQAVGLGLDGPALLEFFHQRTNPSVKPEYITDLIRKLGDKLPAVREKATAELVSLGTVAVPWLRMAAKDFDEQEVATRARKCLDNIEGGTGTAVPIAAARLLAVRAPAGASEALLGYLPYADDENVVEEIKAALATLAYRGGKPQPSLLKALEDQSSLTRVIAAEALAQPGGDEPVPVVRRLLKDPRPTVRLRVALALADHKDAEAIAALISLMGELPVAQGKQAEEYLMNLAGDDAPKGQLTDDASRAKNRDTWLAWWKKSDGNAPLDEIRKRTLNDDMRVKAQEQIKKLGDESFSVRESAQKAIEDMGIAVIPILRQAARDPDPEVSSRCRKCLDELEKKKASPISAIAIRMVGIRKPKGAAEALLAYVPSVEDETITAEVQGALNAVAYPDGKPDPVLVKALDEKSALRRGAAAEALAQSSDPEQRAIVRKLLKDPDPAVRFRVSLALAQSREKEAMPSLIASLADAPFDSATQAESFLRNLAAERSPKESLNTDDESRRKCRDAWLSWWKDNGDKVELARQTESKRLLGYTLLVLANNGRVMEIGLDGKERWHIDGLNNPWDAHVLPRNRVLIAEFNGGRVTERNLKGDILWQKQCQNPICAQRLSNGNTFIAMRNQLIEVDRSGKEVFTFQRNNYDIMGAQKLKDGQMVFFTNNGTAHRLDAKGKEVRTFNIGYMPWGGGDVLSNGHIVVPQWQENRVVEFDADGKQIWEVSFQWPSSAMRITNGNTIVASQNNNKIVEFDRTGKSVWEYQCTNGNPFRVRRR